MALDVYYSDDKQFDKLLFQLTESEFILLKVPFDELKKKGALNIDLYGTTRLYSSHITLIKNYINKRIEEKENKHIFDNMHKRLKKLSIKFELINIEKGIILIGD